VSDVVVLVPTRRDAEEDVRLDHVLHSLLVQTSRPARVIVRDEGRVGAMELREVRQFADLLARSGVEVDYRRVVRPSGVAVARRDLVRSAGDADLVCFVDDDMCLAPDALQVLADVFAAEPDAGFAQGQKIEADERRTYWNDINQLHGEAADGAPFRAWFGDAALLMLRRGALDAVDWDVVARYAVEGLGGEDVALSLMIADRFPCWCMPAAVGWHLSPSAERWRWEAASDVLQLELLRPHVSKETLRRAMPHLAEHVE
jgi:glycosyltransferase involved in cell wall biosynthesis